MDREERRFHEERALRQAEKQREREKKEEHKLAEEKKRKDSEQKIRARELQGQMEKLGYCFLTDKEGNE